jgi:4-aminobutyrate aminotransferase-like enzyme
MAVTHTSPTTFVADRNTVAQLERVLKEAESVGVEEAVSRHGSELTQPVQELMRTLTPEEVTALRGVGAQLVARIAILADSNFNINGS